MTALRACSSSICIFSTLMLWRIAIASARASCGVVRVIAAVLAGTLEGLPLVGIEDFCPR